MASYPIGSAAISWIDSGGTTHLRIYTTDGYTVTERCNDGSDWFTGAFSEPGSDVSATCWNGRDGIYLRVYCTFQDQTVEWCNDPGSDGWFQGAYTVS